MIKTLESVTYDFQPGDVFIDIGGNVGVWTIELFGLYDKIIFIEPSRIAMAQAQRNINGHCEFFGVPELASKVQYFRNICSDVAGEEKSIASTTEDTGNYSVFAKGLYGSENVVLAEDNIPTMTVDSLIPAMKDNAKVLIKIDTEGCDLDVLLGAFEFIKKFKPTIIVEFHWHMYYDQDKRDRVFSLLQSLGYEMQDFMFACYVLNPDQQFDHVNTGKDLERLHFQLAMTPPAI